MATNQSNIDILIKRRLKGGSSDAPSTNALKNGELAMNEQSNTLYYGMSTAANEISAVPIAGDGFIKQVLKTSGSASSTLGTEITANIEVGGITTGEVLSADTTLADLINKLLISVQDPIVVQPSVTLTSNLGSNGSNVEAGTQGINFTATYSDGQVRGINDGGVWKTSLEQSNTFAGPANNYTFTIGGTEYDQDMTHTYNATTTIIGDGSNSYSVKVDFDAGTTQPKKSNNTNFGSTKDAGSVTGNLSYTGKRKAFWAYSANDIPIANSADIRALANGVFKDDGDTINLPMPAGTTNVVFAYPKSYGAVSNVVYVEGLGSSVKDVFTRTEVSVDGANGNSPVLYYVYKKTFSGVGGVTVPLEKTNTYVVTI